MTYEPKVYHRQGGDQVVVDEANGGRILKNKTATAITTAGAETYTAAQIAGGLIDRDPAGAGRTDTTDTAANLISELNLENDGEAFECLVVNTADAAEAITIAGGTGVTVKNAGQTIGQNEAAILVFRRTGAATIDLYIIGA